jgi:hypothetical protein
MKLTSYYPWVEWFPDYAKAISTLAVHPGDKVAVSVTVGGARDAYHPLGATLYWYMQNITAGTASSGTIAPPAYSISGGSCSGWCTPFTGAMAEWIMERPTTGGVIYDLANFGSATIANPVALESGSFASVSPASPALTWPYTSVTTNVTDLLDMYRDPNDPVFSPKLAAAYYNLFDGSIGFKWLAYK